jgi:hypothetical protein
MTNTLKHRIIRKIFPQQQKTPTGKATDAGVGQDKGALGDARLSSAQASRTTRTQRARPTTENIVRSPITNTARRKREKLTLWVNPVVKAELQRRAASNKLSLSSTGGALLEKSLQQSVDMEYGALLEPAIREEIRRNMRSYSSRIALLLVRVAFSAEQTRALVTNILDRQPGVDPDILTTLLDHSANAAKRKITAKSPQLQRIIAEVESWFTEREETKGGK